MGLGYKDTAEQIESSRLISTKPRRRGTVELMFVSGPLRRWSTELVRKRLVSASFVRRRRGRTHITLLVGFWSCNEASAWGSRLPCPVLPCFAPMLPYSGATVGCTGAAMPAMWATEALIANQYMITTIVDKRGIKQQISSKQLHVLAEPLYIVE